MKMLHTARSISMLSRVRTVRTAKAIPTIWTIDKVFAIIFIALQAYITVAMAQNGNEKSFVNSEANVSGELTKIKQEKLAIDANLKKQEAACYKKFAVNDCLKDAKLESQAALNAVKRRELALNDQQRQLKIESIQRKKEISSIKSADGEKVDGNTSEVSGKTKTLKTVTSAKTIKSDAEILTEKNTAEKSRTAAAQKRLIDSNQKQAESQKKANARVSQQSQSAVNTARYNEKIKQAHAHKAELEKTNSEKKKVKAAALPLPTFSTFPTPALPTAVVGSP
jgi:colicin import membrane protein